MVGLTCNEEPLSVCYIPALARPRLFTKHHQRGKPTSHLEPVWAPRSLIVVFDFASCPPAGVMSYNSAAFYCAVYVMTHRLRGAPSPPPSGPLRLLLRGPFSSQCMVTSLRRPPTSGLVSPAQSAAALPELHAHPSLLGGLASVPDCHIALDAPADSLHENDPRRPRHHPAPVPFFPLRRATSHLPLSSPHHVLALASTPAFPSFSVPLLSPPHPSMVTSVPSEHSPTFQCLPHGPCPYLNPSIPVP